MAAKRIIVTLVSAYYYTAFMALGSKVIEYLAPGLSYVTRNLKVMQDMELELNCYSTRSENGLLGLNAGVHANISMTKGAVPCTMI